MCAQQLCEASTEMAGALVKGDIHLLLFGMLNHVEQERVDGVSIMTDSGGEEGEDGGCKCVCVCVCLVCVCDMHCVIACSPTRVG